MLEKRIHKFKSSLYSAVLGGALVISGSSIVHSAESPVQGEEQLPAIIQAKGYAQALKLIASLRPELQQRLDIRFYRATSLAGIGKNREAIEDFEKLIEQRPEYPEFYNNLAMLLVEEGKLLEAQQVLELGLSSNKSYAMLYNNLTVVFETMARRSYAKALRIKESKSPVLKPLVMLEGFTPPVKDKPVTGVAVVKRDVNESKGAINRQIENQILSWSNSWQKKNIADYIDSYAPNFKSRAYHSHAAWLKGRSERIGKSSKIVISIDAITVKVLPSGRVQADFIMDYRSDRYSDRSKKRLVFKQIEGRWRIVHELTLKVIKS